MSKIKENASGAASGAGAIASTTAPVGKKKKGKKQETIFAMSAEDKQDVKMIRRRAGLSEQWDDEDDWNDDEEDGFDDKQDQFLYVKQEMVKVLQAAAKAYAVSERHDDVLANLMGLGLTLGQAGVVDKALVNLVNEIEEMM